MKKTIYILCVLLLTVFSSCYKDLGIVDDPYAGGKESLGLVFAQEEPIPEIANPGDVVIFKVKGALAYVDKGLDFFFFF